MLPILLSSLLVLALVFSITVAIKKRKKAGITGIKSALTTICLYLIAVTNLLAYWFNFMGLVNWTISVIFLILGAYFMKYMPMAES